MELFLIELKLHRTIIFRLRQHFRYDDLSQSWWRWRFLKRTNKIQFCVDFLFFTYNQLKIESNSLGNFLDEIIEVFTKFNVLREFIVRCACNAMTWHTKTFEVNQNFNFLTKSSKPWITSKMVKLFFENSH